MKASKLREYTEDELRQVCEETRKALCDLRVRKGAGDSSQQPLRLRTLRRELARIKTVMKERGMGEHV